MQPFHQDKCNSKKKFPKKFPRPISSVSHRLFSSETASGESCTLYCKFCSPLIQGIYTFFIRFASLISTGIASEIEGGFHWTAMIVVWHMHLWAKLNSQISCLRWTLRSVTYFHVYWNCTDHYKLIYLYLYLYLYAYWDRTDHYKLYRPLLKLYRPL